MKVVLAGAAALLLAAPAVAGTWRPPPGATFQIQFTGRLNLSVPAQVYEVDNQVDRAVVERLHRSGRRVVCYLNGGAWENWRPDASSFPSAALGKPLQGWPGERWLDIRKLSALAPIMRKRLDTCKSKGFDAVDADNVDGYANASGFPLTAADQLRYNRWLAAAAHARGLAIALKNDGGQARRLAPVFDFAVVEQCFQYRECSIYLPFVRAHKAVFDLEYALAPAQYCPQARKLGIVAMTKKLALDARREAC